MEWKNFENFIIKYVLQIGGSCIALTGLIYLIIYSIQQGYITPAFRVGALTTVSAALLVAGEYIHNKSKIWAIGVSALGIAGLSTSLVLSIRVYNFFTEPYGLSFFAVALLGTFFAQRYSSQTLGVITFLAAFLMPLGFNCIMHEAPVSVPLFLALFVIVSLLKQWYILFSLAFITGISEYVMGYRRFEKIARFLHASIYVSIFLILTTACELFHKRFKDYFLPAAIFVACFLWRPSFIISSLEIIKLSVSQSYALDALAYILAVVLIYFYDARARNLMVAYSLSSLLLSYVFVISFLQSSYVIFIVFVVYGIVLYLAGFFAQQIVLRGYGFFTLFLSLLYHYLLQGGFEVQLRTMSEDFFLYTPIAMGLLFITALLVRFVFKDQKAINSKFEAFIFETFGILLGLMLLYKLDLEAMQAIGIATGVAFCILLYGIFARYAPLRDLSYIIFVLISGILHVMIMGKSILMQEFLSPLSIDALPHILIILIILLSAYVSYYFKDRFDEDDNVAWKYLELGALLVTSVTLCMFAQDFILGAVISLFGLLVVALGLYQRSFEIRIWGYFNLLGASFMYLAFYLQNNELSLPADMLAAVLTLAYETMAVYIIIRYNKLLENIEHNAGMLVSLYTGVVLSSGLLISTVIGFPYNTVLLALIAVGLLGMGVAYKQNSFKVVSFVALAFVLIDISHRILKIEDLFYRFVALIAIGALFIVASLVYQYLSRKER